MSPSERSGRLANGNWTRAGARERATIAVATASGRVSATAIDWRANNPARKLGSWTASRPAKITITTVATPAVAATRTARRSSSAGATVSRSRT